MRLPGAIPWAFFVGDATAQQLAGLGVVSQQVTVTAFFITFYSVATNTLLTTEENFFEV
jgi:hypothetical protein